MMLSCQVLAVVVYLALCGGTVQSAEAAGHGQRPMSWDYDNVTARYLEAAAAELLQPRDEHVQFNTRVPKRPFAKKNNFLSFETKNNNIEVLYMIEA